MDPVAESLTGWRLAEAANQPLATVFRIETNRHEIRSQTRGRGVDLWLARRPGDHTDRMGRGGREWRIGRGAAAVRHAGDLVGAVRVFCDGSERQRAEQGVEDARAFAEGIVETVREPLVVLDADLRVKTANRSFYQTFNVTPTQTEGRPLFELGNRQWDIPRLRQLLEEILPRDSHFNGFEVEHKFEGIGHRSMVLNARRLPPVGSQAWMILLAIEDVTERQRAPKTWPLRGPLPPFV